MSDLISRSALVVLFVAATCAAISASAQSSDALKWTPWLEGGGFYNNKNASRGEGAVWVPLVQSAVSVFFAEARGKLFEEDQREGNIALGYRQMMGGDLNLGVWGGYDARRSALGSNFRQAAAGMEALSRNFDLRINGYLPLNNSVDVSTSSSTTGGGSPTIFLNGPSILMQSGVISTTTTTRELAIKGLDAEVGFRIPLETLRFDATKYEMRVFAGAFYFDDPDALKPIAGPKTRVEFSVNDVIDALPGSKLTLETEYSHDDVRGNRFEIGARFRIPLGGSDSRQASLSAQERRISERLRRDTDVITSAASTTSSINTLTTEAVKDQATGVNLDKVATVNGGTVGGISGVSTAQGANTLIVAQGGNGTFNGVSILQASQTLVGGGASIALQGRTTGLVAKFTASGSQPTLQNTADGSVVGAYSNTHIAGLNIVGSGINMNFNHGISTFNNNQTNMVMEGNTLSSIGGNAIALNGSSNIQILNNTVDTLASAINTGAGNSNVLIRGNTLTSQSFVINAADGMSGLTIDSNTLNNTSGNAGIGIASNGNNIKITSNTINSPLGGIAVQLLSNNIGLDISGNTIQSTASGAIFVAGTGNVGNIGSNTFTGTKTAIALFGNANTLAGTNNVKAGTVQACQNFGVNPGTSITFTTGQTCP